MVYSPSDAGGVNEDYVLSGNFDTCETVFALSESFGGTTRGTGTKVPVQTLSESSVQYMGFLDGRRKNCQCIDPKSRHTRLLEGLGMRRQTGLDVLCSGLFARRGMRRGRQEV